MLIKKKMLAFSDRDKYITNRKTERIKGVDKDRSIKTIIHDLTVCTCTDIMLADIVYFLCSLILIVSLLVINSRKKKSCNCRASGGSGQMESLFSRTINQL